MKIINGWAFPDFDNLLSNYASRLKYPEIDYQQSILDQALAFVSKFDQALDIGANVGFHSVRLSKLFLQVKCFEPSTINFECLSHNTKNLDNIEIFKYGVGDEKIKLNLEIITSSDNCGAFSFKDFVDINEDKILEESEIIRIDDLNFEPDFIKIDTQGFEKKVLLGSINTIEKFKPVILAEVGKKGPTKELLSLIEPFGYKLVAMSNRDKVFAAK